VSVVESARIKNEPVEQPGNRTAAPAGAYRRGIPGWLIALVSAGLAIGYGMVIEKMYLGPGLVMLGLGGMTLALSGMALWRMIDPLARPDVATLKAHAPQRLRELDREKQAVLKAIKEIELDYQMRKIAEVDYREMIERYRARAMRLISEIEAGDNYRELIERELKDRLAVLTATGQPETAAAPIGALAPESASASASACPACHTPNDNDAQFCKKCGVKLETA
jgi:hypothetical protein